MKIISKFNAVNIRGEDTESEMKVTQIYKVYFMEFANNKASLGHLDIMMGKSPPFFFYLSCVCIESSYLCDLQGTF